MNTSDLNSVKLGDLVRSTNNGYDIICMVVGVPKKGHQYVDLKIMNQPTNKYFPKRGTVFQQSPHNKLWTQLSGVN
jgi:hypothetical protein